MSQCFQSTDGFIKTLFGPRVAVLCSQDAEIISRRNNLSFTELIRPFTSLTSEIQVRDPTGQSHVIRDLHMTMCDLRCTPPDDVTLKQMLSEVVTNASNVGEDSKTMNFESDRYEVNINMTCSWFEAYRDVLTSTATQKPHEFINHCLACLLVVSSSHPNPLEEFANLSQHQNHIQHNSQHAPLRWMTPNTLKYYVLLHDNSNAEQEKARTVINDLQAMYGSSACHMLRINSNMTISDLQLPDPWGRYVSHKAPATRERNGLAMNEIAPQDSLNVDPLTISTETHPNDVGWVRELKQSAVVPQKGYGCCLTLADHDSLRSFMQEFALKGLIPHTEKLIRNFHEQIASRKAIHRSFFRATRTLFGGGKTASAPALKNYGGGGLDSPELQVRKLGDLFFICQMYEHAYQHHHSVRKDFANEQAWLHAAGASEMAALSNFMQLRASKPYPAHYVDSAIDAYMTNSGDNYLAVRCAMISLECLRTQGMYNEAALQLKRLVNESNDLQSAIIWEQVAQCHLRTRKPALRKFAFYILLAGHRYVKALQRKCALMCYKSALQVYSATGWDVAIDFINFTIGRLSLQLQQFDQAVLTFHQLLKHSNQPTSQQAMYVNEYLHVAKLHAEATKSSTTFPLPLIVQSKTTIRNTELSPSLMHEDLWDAMEESFRTVTFKEAGNNSMFNPIRKKSSAFHAVVNEPIWIDVCVRNPLQVPLSLRNASLLLEFDSKDSAFNVENPMVEEYKVPEASGCIISFYLNPHNIGHIRVVGVSYSLAVATTTVLGSQSSAHDVALPGRQLFDTLSIVVCKAMPRLDVAIDSFPLKLMGGEVKASKVILTNVGQRSMRNAKVAFDSSTANCLFATPDQQEMAVKNYFLGLANQNNDQPRYSVQSFCDVELSSGEQFELAFWLQSPVSEGRTSLNFMFYYEPTEDPPEEMRYRVVKYTSDLYTKPSLHLATSVIKDNSQTGYVISTEVKNTSLASQVNLRKVSCSSESWEISSMTASCVDALEVGQTTQVYFLVKDKSIARDSTGNLQHVTLNGETSDDDLTACDSPRFQLSEVLRSGKVVESESLDHLMVALQWEAEFENQTSTGMHHIPLGEIKTDTSSLARLGLNGSSDVVDGSSESLVALHQLVKWKFAFDPLHKHDFKKSGLCFVLVTITLQNQYNCQLRVNVNGVDSNQSQSNAGLNTRFLWAGKSLSKFIMQPKKTHEVTMRACFPAPGVYNLNSFGVWAIPIRIEGKTPLLPQNCHYSSLITVHDHNYGS